MINLDQINSINWNNQQVGILGAGVSGLGAAKLARYLKMKVLLSDSKINTIELKTTSEFQFECGHSKRILDSDFIIKSPGISNQSNIVKSCLKKNIPIVSEIEFASWFSNSEIIAVTGSNGKTTTVNLLFEILKNAGVELKLGGNIGTSYSENVLEELKNNQKIIHLLEISSYQAENLVHFKPSISCILNISEDHMDRYSNINEYIDAKLNITKNSSKESKMVYNADDPYLKERITNSKNHIPFSINSDNLEVEYNDNQIVFKDNESLNILDVQLKGIHNIYNILAASTISKVYGISSEKIVNSLKKFKPLPHRIEFVRTIDGVTYINDSKSTNIASTIAAIDCFENINLIIGGESKGGINVRELNRDIVNHKNIKNLIIYGSVTKKIKDNISKNIHTYYFNDFQDAINTSIKISTTGDCVLLSPAFSSFDQFINYKERGNTFIDLIKEYANAK